jgi:hypothetical protein
MKTITILKLVIITFDNDIVIPEKSKEIDKNNTQK